MILFIRGSKLNSFWEPSKAKSSLNPGQSSLSLYELWMIRKKHIQGEKYKTQEAFRLTKWSCSGLKPNGMYVKNFQIHYYIITLLNVNSLIKIVYVDNVCMIIKINIYLYIICMYNMRSQFYITIYVHVFMYVCMYVCIVCIVSIYVCTYIYIYIYIYM